MLQQHPLLIVAVLLLMAVFMVFTLGSLVTWVFLIVRAVKGTPILSVAAWQPRAWGMLDLLIVLILVVMSQVAAVFLGKSLLGMDPAAMQAEGEVSLGLAALVSGGYLVVMLLGTLWIMVRYSVPASHVGFTSNISQVAKIGVIGGIAILPFIYLGNALVSLGSGVEYDHPLFEAMGKDGSPVNFLLAVFAAAVVAPLAEEFLFRGILQGWLQSIPFRSMAETLVGRIGSADSYAQPMTAETSLGDSSVNNTEQLASRSFAPDGSEIIEAEILEATSSNPYLPPSGPSELTAGEPAQHSPQMLHSSLVPPIWPSVVAGILFGLAHYSYGLSFIPLSIFGILLGLLYRATHSIWPCVIVHFMMNASSMLALGVTVYIKAITGG